MLLSPNHTCELKVNAPVFIKPKPPSPNHPHLVEFYTIEPKPKNLDSTIFF